MPREPTYKSEAAVKKQVKKLLTEAGFFYWMPSANGFGMQGVADILAVKHGRILAIETKFAKGKPTILQQRFLENIRSHGGVALVINETNIDELAAALT